SRLYDAVIFVGPARTGKTNALVDGYVAYKIECDPGDGLIVQISEEKAREFSKKRIDRMLVNSPRLVGRMSPRG
ncbi:phage terminase large subunit family protein, partial [Cobetia amphilecti]